MQYFNNERLTYMLSWIIFIWNSKFHVFIAYADPDYSLTHIKRNS